MKTLNDKKKQKLSNQGLVFDVFGDNEKLTIAEITDRVNERLKSESPDERLSDSTIRRAIEGLTQSNFIRSYGRQNNATLYGKLSAAFENDQGAQRLVNFSGEFLTVEEFLKLIVGPQEHPLQKSSRLAVTSSEMEHQIRRRLAFVIWSAGNPGLNKQLEVVMKELHNVLREYQYAANLLQNFLDSPVWYEQYRDRIGAALRKVQENDPALFQLTDDYVKGG